MSVVTFVFVFFFMVGLGFAVPDPLLTDVIEENS